jgi:glycosyltransferase involved in cell wall biosynthesis
VNPGPDSSQSDPPDRVGGRDSSEAREALDLIHQRARQQPGIVVLIRPSIQVAISAIRGAVESRSIHGPTRVYVTESRRKQLTDLFCELSKLNLIGEVTLYHGSLNQFFRDLPLRAALICADFDALHLDAAGLRSLVPAGTLILSLESSSAAGNPTAPKHLIDSGILELQAVEPGGAVYRATRLCHGSGLMPNADLRIALQRRLHERYFLAEVTAGISYTPVADLTEEIRRQFSREYPAASGSGPWPYVAPESAGLPLTLPSGKPWPKVSIVTPTRNQGKYIEETILSVLNQDYPSVEHIVVDGASTDETHSILERYRDKLALIISEPDNGQSQAINKGMSKATGEILTWLNSDDLLAPGALAAVALAFDLNRADMISGTCRLYRDGRLLDQHVAACPDGPLPLDDLLDLDHGWTAGEFFRQPEVMFTREIWLRAGAHLDEGLFYSMDYELWLRFSRAGACLHVIGRPLAWFRVHEQQKTYAMSSYVPELTACRDAFLRENGLPPRSAPRGPSGREKLRITLLNDNGAFYGAGIAHVRIARALAWAGHEVNLLAILDGPAHRIGSAGYTSESVLDWVSATNPDVVVVGNLCDAKADPTLLHLLSEKFPTLVVLHDFWILTGRCGYTFNCDKYLTGCDETCPTANEYPVLPPEEIADAWLKKQLLLGAKVRPMLLPYSEWAETFARKALGVAVLSEQGPAPMAGFRLSFPLDIFQPRDRRVCREMLGLPLDRFIVLLPASLDDPRKGARPFLDALARLELPSLLVVTIGWPSANLDCPIEVVQLGYFNDAHKVAVLNSAVDVVVAPSSAETFGQIFMEAIACGTPVAGYPVAAVPEAIRDGVTGVLASDDTPASLAAATLHLYTHPGFRDDLARWGRLYAENEWSEFSGYRSIFMALFALGLGKTLDLRRMIRFLPGVPAIPPLQFVWKSPSCWRPCRGFSGIEHSVEHDLEAYRWAYGPTALAEILVDTPGLYNVLIAYRNPHADQSVKLRLNGEVLGTYQLPNTGYDSTRVLVLDVRFNCECNLLHFEFARWYSEDEREWPQAIMVREILVEKTAEWDQGPQQQTSHQALAAQWGQIEGATK